jgi:hypothetical protein
MAFFPVRGLLELTTDDLARLKAGEEIVASVGNGERIVLRVAESKELPVGRQGAPADPFANSLLNAADYEREGYRVIPGSAPAPLTEAMSPRGEPPAPAIPRRLSDGLPVNTPPPKTDHLA